MLKDIVYFSSSGVHGFLKCVFSFEGKIYKK